MGEGSLPATWQLGLALVWGFLMFNQLLFAGMDLLFLGRHEADAAAKFGLASLIVGGLVFIANCVFFVIARPKLLTDWQVLGVSLGIGLVGGYRLGSIFGGPIVIGFTLANLLISIWLSRGLWKQPASKKGQKF